MNLVTFCQEIAGGVTRCRGETFQIQTTSPGPIELKKDFSRCNYPVYTNRNIAFLYGRSQTSRGGGCFWLSKSYYWSWHQNALYTMPCPGSMFNEDDIPRCDNEVFTVENIATVSSSDIFKDPIFLRNGDYIAMSSNDGVQFWGFLLTQYQRFDDFNSP